jgi:hypothetical protein
VRGEGRNWRKPDKKDIKKEETKQKTMVKGNSKPNQIPDTGIVPNSTLSTFQKSLPTHNGNGTVPFIKYRYRTVGTW